MDEVVHAKKKLKNKNLDLIVLNSLKDKGAGFGYDTNKITLIDSAGNSQSYNLKSKREVAIDIANKILALKKSLKQLWG
jgi:phosphopantothenoylcysteine decarboxylase/phosphopantothenate--cysteine ligase